MNFKKYVNYGGLVCLTMLFLVFFCSCKSGGTGKVDEMSWRSWQGKLRAAENKEVDPDDQLTEEEVKFLIRWARIFLTKDDKFANMAQREKINNTEPEVKILYIAPKTGRAALTWDFARVALRAEAWGQLDDKSCTWKVVRILKSKVEINKNPGADFNKVKKVTGKEFESLKKEFTPKDIRRRSK